MSKVVRQPESEREPAPDVLERAFADYHSELLGTLYYLVGNIEDARDSLQEAFIKCWRHQDQIADVQNLKAWIFRIALNTGRDLRQTAWRRKRKGLPEGEDLTSQKDGPQTVAESNERMDQLRVAIAALRSEEQEVFLLRQNGQLKYEEIAEAIGIPLGTVKTRMRLAIANLRQAMSDA